MNGIQENDQKPLYINRKASTVIIRENGRAFIKEGGNMNEAFDTVKVSEPIKSIGLESQPAVSSTETMNKDGAGSIDKIRDLIFGTQMQDYEKRFSRLEERLFKEMSESRNESKKSLDSLEKYISKEIEMLKDRIAQEQTSRMEAFKELSRQLRETTRSFEKKIDSLSDQLTNNSNDLHQEISELSQSLRNEIRLRYEEAVYLIEQSVEELRNDKMNRASLANFLSEMAMRINNDKG